MSHRGLLFAGFFANIFPFNEKGVIFATLWKIN